MAVYTAVFVAVSVTAAQDAFEIVAPSDGRVRIREVRLGQYSDAGDTEAEMISVKIMRGHTTTGSGGSTVTPANTSGHTGALTSSSTGKANNTTVATSGSPVTLLADAWNVQAGWWSPPEEVMPLILEVSQRMVVRITAPADALTMNGTLIFEECGMTADRIDD